MKTCPNCNAPLPAVFPGQVAVCRFCHAETRENLPPRELPLTPFRPTPVSPSQTTKAAPIAVGIGMSFGAMVLVAAVVFLSARSTGMRSSKSSSPLTGKGAEAVATPADIPKIVDAGKFGWTDIAAPGMKGSFGAFDVIGNVPWAIGIAKNWSSDAEIAGIYLKGVRPDGVLDVSGHDDSDVDYRFGSKNLAAAQDKLREVSEKRLLLEFRLWIKQGKVQFMADTSGSSSAELAKRPTPSFGCPLTTVLENAKKGGLAPRPSYSLIAIYNDSKKLMYWHSSGNATSSNKMTSTDSACKPW